MPDAEKKLMHLRWLAVVFDVIKIIFIATIIVTGVRLFIAEPFIVSGDSMVPTFNSNDYLIIDELSYEFKTPKRGDVVVFRYPLDPSVYFIKRLIGVPGDIVVVSNEGIFIQSGKLAPYRVLEPYVSPSQTKSETATTTLGEDEYFVLGDNRNASSDSRAWGPVQKRYLIGRAVARLYPFSRAVVFRSASATTSSVSVAPTLSTGK